MHVLYNFHTQRKQKDVVCRGWVLNPSDRVAQLVERRSSNSKVAGSRPSRGRQHLSACAGYGKLNITHSRTLALELAKTAC